MMLESDENSAQRVTAMVLENDGYGAIIFESDGDSVTCDTRCSNASSFWWCENTLQWC
jgi:hypothetical protein